MATISLKLDTKLHQELEKKAHMLNTEPAKLILKAIDNYLYYDKINQVRAIMDKYIQKHGCDCDDDFFKEKKFKS